MTSSMPHSSVWSENSAAPQSIAGRPDVPRSPAGRTTVLDGLRSLVLLVLLVHFSDDVPFSPAWQAGHLALQVTAAVALDVFFVLSGFLITGILLATRDHPHYFRNFFVRRVLRIFPLYYGFLLVFFVVLPAVSMRFEPLEPIQHVYYWAYLVNIVRNFGADIAPSTGHFWSLAVEEQFYVLWPAVVYACSPTSLKRVCIGLLVAGPALRAVMVYVLPDPVALHQLYRFDVLAMGALLAVLWRTGEDRSQLRHHVMRGAAVALASAVTLGVAAALSLASITVAIATFSSASAYLAGAFFLMTLQAPSDGVWARFWSSWPLRRIGMYSYAIYVLHDPIVDVFARYGIVHMPSTVGQAVRYCLVMIPVCVGAGALSWHLFEVHFFRLKDHFTYARPIAGSPAGER